MISITLNPQFPLIMRPQAPSVRNSFGGGIVQIRRLADRVYYEFELKLRFPDRASAENWMGFAAYHQGDTPFWFDGGPYGSIETPIIIGIGDGSTTDFFCPRRNIFASSWVFYVNGVITAASTVNESSGMVTFGSAPANNAIITGKGMNRFKCVIWNEEAALHAISDLYPNVYEEPQILFREIP